MSERSSRTGDGAFRFVKRNPIQGYRRAYLVFDRCGEYVGVVMMIVSGSWFGWRFAEVDATLSRKQGPFQTRFDAARTIAKMPASGSPDAAGRE